MSKSKSQKPVKFEDAIEQLEGIIEQIESGEVGLEDCLVQYEQGMALIKHCRQVLSKAEKKIAELAPDEKGGLSADDDVIEGEADES